MVIRVRRMYCKVCKKTVSLLPPFVVRYGRWCLDVLITSVVELCTKQTSLVRIWSQVLVAPMDLKTFSRLLHQVRIFANTIQDRLISFLRQLDPLFRIDTLEKRSEILSGKWSCLGESVIIIQAFNEYRQLNGFQPVSVMGLLHFLARHDSIPWV